MNRDVCKSCGKKWEDHNGATRLCAEVERLKKRLRTIHHHATKCGLNPMSEGSRWVLDAIRRDSKLEGQSDE